jgi:nitronate monooxygenase
MPIRTVLTELLGIEHPILLAPMAGVSGGTLAAAVSHAGGMGLIGGGYGDRDWLKREFAAAGNARIGVGFITWSLARQPELLDLALEHAPAAMMLSFGDFRPFVPPIRRTDAKLIVQVQTVAQARQAAAEGVDIIVAQGTEAGGHGGARATFPLVPAVVDLAGSIPVVAAGGIADGRGLAASLMLGAAGVLSGTAFFASTESLADSNAKAAAVEATGDNTIRSSVFDMARGLDWPPNWNLRTLQNDFTRQWHGDMDSLTQNIERERQRFETARGDADTTVAAVIAGEAVDLLHRQEPAGTIVHRMVIMAVTRLRQASLYLGDVD